MKSIKNITWGAIVALAFNVASITSAQAAMTYPDIDYNQPYLRGIMGMTQSGIVQGYKDGTFRPDSHVSRIEALKIILKSANVSVRPLSETQFVSPPVDDRGNLITATPTPMVRSIGFPDIPLDSWYAPYVNTGEQKEIIHGYPDGLFRPQDPVTRVEAYKMLFRSFGVLLDAPVEGEDWFTPYVKYALDHNLANFGDNPNFNLNDTNALISRAEFTDLAFRLRNISVKTPSSRFSTSSYPEVSISSATINTDLFGLSTTSKSVARSDSHYMIASSSSTVATMYSYVAQNYEEAKAIVQAKFKKDITYQGILLAHDNFAAGAYNFSLATWNSPFENTGLTYAQWYAMKATSMLQEGYLQDKNL